MKDTIAIDIDSTAFDTDEEILNYIGLFYNEVFHKRQIENDLEDLNVDNFVIRDSIDLAVSNTKLKRHVYSKRCIKWLAEFFNICFITYRDMKFEDETNELLSIFDIPYNLIFSTREKGKHNIVFQKDIKVIIEDDTKTIIDISERTNATVLIYDQPWNKKIVQDYNKVRVYNWKEIKDYFIIRGV